MTRARPVPVANPISGIPASKVTKITEMRTRARQVVTRVAPMAAATAEESRPSGRTKASIFSTRVNPQSTVGREYRGPPAPPGTARTFSEQGVADEDHWRPAPAVGQ